MINLKSKVTVSLEVATLATLLSGLYSVYATVDPRAIPVSLYLEIAEKLIPYLENWDYEKLSFEDWVKYNLLIVPRALIEDDIDEFKENELYFERDNGNVVLVVTAEMV